MSYGAAIRVHLAVNNADTNARARLSGRLVDWRMKPNITQHVFFCQLFSFCCCLYMPTLTTSSRLPSVAHLHSIRLIITIAFIAVQNETHQLSTHRKNTQWKCVMRYIGAQHSVQFLQHRSNDAPTRFIFHHISSSPASLLGGRLTFYICFSSFFSLSLSPPPPPPPPSSDLPISKERNLRQIRFGFSFHPPLLMLKQYSPLSPHNYILSIVAGILFHSTGAAISINA